MLYRFLRFWVRLALRVFYKKIQVRNAEFIQTSAPVIVVSNHPNTLMDPLIVAALFPQPLFFLANASLFKGKFMKKVFDILGLIPIYRKQDVRKAAEKPDNRAIFAKCYEYLAKKASILIFPEGTSFVERRLREIKTGTARMALGAENENAFGLGLSIVSVGINYSHPTNFRSEVFVSLDAPIRVSDFREIFEKKETEAVEKLTETIRQTLEKNMIITKDHDEDLTVTYLEKIYRPYLAQKLGVSEANLEQRFELTNNMIKALRFFEENEKDQTHSLKQKIWSYIQVLEQKKFRDDLVPFSDKIGLLGLLGRGILLLISAPIFLYGFLNNYLPYKLPSLIARKITSDIEFWAGIMMVSGLFLFGFFYTAQIAVFSLFFAWRFVLIYAFSLPISGFFALFYSQQFLDLLDRWRLSKAWEKDPVSMKKLIDLRQEILGELENFRLKREP